MNYVDTVRAIEAREAEEQRKRDLIDKMVCPPGIMDGIKQADLRTYVYSAPGQVAVNLLEAGWSRNVFLDGAVKSDDVPVLWCMPDSTPSPQIAELKHELERTQQTVELAVNANRNLRCDFDIVRAQVDCLVEQRDAAYAEIAILTEALDNARANAECFAALLNRRNAPQPEPSLTPDGALAPIPRGSALGNTLAALMAVKGV